MIVVDTSGLVAYLDRSSAHHEACVAAVDDEPGPFLLSPLVLAEVDYLLLTRLGQYAELAFLDEVVRGAYRLEPMTAGDIATATEVVRRYSDLRLGAADASVLVLAARYGVNRVLTLDERHFRAVSPLDDAGHFRLVPADQ